MTEPTGAYEYKDQLFLMQSNPEPASPATELCQTLGQLPLADAAVEANLNVLELEQLLAVAHTWPGCIIRDNEAIIGILSRRRLAAALSRRFARDLFAKASLHKLVELNLVDASPLVFSQDTTVSECSRTALAREPAMAYEPVIVMRHGSPYLLEVDILMRAQSALLQQANAELLASEQRLEAEVAKRTLELKRTNADLLEKQLQIDAELEVARNIQQSILPAQFPVDHRYDGDAFMKAARMIGGDFYDLFTLDEHRLAMVVADVSGKGVPAALFMMLVRAILQDVAPEHRSPADCVARVNELLGTRNQVSLFVTLVYGILDVTCGTFVFCNGGHSMPYLRRANGSVEYLTERGSPLVGLLDEASYRDLEVKLQPGDSLLLVTDGIAERFAPDGLKFGHQRLLQFIQECQAVSPTETLQALNAELERFSAGLAQSDDVTALMLRYKG